MALCPFRNRNEKERELGTTNQTTATDGDLFWPCTYMSVGCEPMAKEMWRGTHESYYMITGKLLM